MAPQQRLLSRDNFHDQVMGRFDGKCCRPECTRPAANAHHILERRLWANGGYYLTNGAPVCDVDHLKAETTEISVEDLRLWCGIKDPILPPQFDDGEILDKWGNPILPNGTRLRGELFFEEPVQKALKQGGFLNSFTHLVKYPKTWRVPWTIDAPSNDRVLPNMSNFIGRRVIVTEKMDGESCSMYQDHIHARSLDSKHHPSRDWIKGFWSSIRYDIPEFWRICGESLYAAHSIKYQNLPSWFLGFSIWNERNVCLSWDETVDWFTLIGSSSGTCITPVPTLYDDIYDENAIRRVWDELLAKDQKSEVPKTGRIQREGYVIRLADSFTYRDFRNSVAKFVRPNHVQTDRHWMNGPIIANGLALS